MKKAWVLSLSVGFAALLWVLGASELMQNVFGKDKNPSRLVYGVASLPLGTPVELEVIF